MATRNDFLLTSWNGDLSIINGDLVTGDSNNQAVHDLLNDPKGYWKEFPSVGLGLINLQNGNFNNMVLKSNISNQLKSDGYHINSLVVKYNQGTDTVDIIPNVSI